MADDYDETGWGSRWAIMMLHRATSFRMAPEFIIEWADKA